MGIFTRRNSGRWESWALLDYGDHGLGATRQDPNRVGFIELTDTLRWVPQAGAGWEVPISKVIVKTPKTWLNRPLRGVEVEIPQLGTLRIRAVVLAPGTVAPRGTGLGGDGRRSGRLLTELLARGASNGAQGRGGPQHQAPVWD